MIKPERKHNIVYKTTNIVTNKFYYGVHSTDNLDDGYMGSGSVLKKSIKKYGKENFTKEIIADYPTRKEASNHEASIVTLDLIELKECYNLKTGGDNEYTHYQSVETRAKISERTKGVNNPMYGRLQSNATRELIRLSRVGKYSGESSPNYGKQLTEETKSKIGIRNKLRYSNKENHPNYGKSLSEEVRLKIKESNPLSKPCSILGKRYDSVRDAVRDLKIVRSTVRYRLDSKNIAFKGWFYLESVE